MTASATPKIMHPYAGRGRVTAAYYFSRDENGLGLLHVGFAFCSPKDQFSRAKGRLIATSRLFMLKRRYVLCGFLHPDATASEVQTVCRALAYVEGPSWTRHGRHTKCKECGKRACMCSLRRR